ncbi:hypothetical protein [Ilumatobacter fluminis]|uniref:hypothetical protein n=1 Tax=Ilumatobacter fluminis TaxID=467091 RepID=UPI00105B8C10|nr:hypothetical protein [Ilumatobacter fluminis]
MSPKPERVTDVRAEEGTVDGEVRPDRTSLMQQVLAWQRSVGNQATAATLDEAAPTGDQPDATGPGVDLAAARDVVEMEPLVIRAGGAGADGGGSSGPDADGGGESGDASGSEAMEADSTASARSDPRAETGEPNTDPDGSGVVEMEPLVIEGRAGSGVGGGGAGAGDVGSGVVEMEPLVIEGGAGRGAGDVGGGVVEMEPLVVEGGAGSGVGDVGGGVVEMEPLVVEGGAGSGVGDVGGGVVEMEPLVVEGGAGSGVGDVGGGVVEMEPLVIEGGAGSGAGDVGGGVVEMEPLVIEGGAGSGAGPGSGVVEMEPLVIEGGAGRGAGDVGGGVVEMEPLVVEGGAGPGGGVVEMEPSVVEGRAGGGAGDAGAGRGAGDGGSGVVEMEPLVIEGGAGRGAGDVGGGVVEMEPLVIEGRSGPAETELTTPGFERRNGPGSASVGGGPAPPTTRGGGGRQSGGGGRSSGGGGGRPSGGGGGGAAPRPAPLGDAGLEQWRSASQASVDGVADGDLSATAEGAGDVSSEGESIDQLRRGEAPEFESELRSQQAPVPEDAPRPTQLDTMAADGAISSIESAAGERLPTQQLSPVGTPPPYAGLNPADYVPNTRREAVADLERQLESPDLTEAERADLTRQLEAARAEVAAIEERAGAPTAAEPPISVSDAGPASLEPLPAGQADLIGDAVARLLGQVDDRAQGVVTGAVAATHGQQVPAMVALGDERKPDVVSEIDRELRGIADAAGVTEEQLTAKVTEQQQAVEAERDAQVDEIRSAGTAASSAVSERGAEETGEAAAARQAVDSENASIRDAVTGEADTADIERTRDDYLGRARTLSAQAKAGVRASMDRRREQLREAGDQVKRDAGTAADRQAAAIRRHWADDEDPNKATVEARPTTSWGRTRASEADAEVTRLTTAAQTEADRITETIDERAEQARETIRDWAAGQEGRERSFWERLVDSFQDWWADAEADNEAWERQRNAETRDRMVADLDSLTALTEARATGSREAFNEEWARLDADQQQLAQQFFQGGMSSIGFVAETTMRRIASRRTPELATAFETEAIASFGGLELAQLAQATNSGFNPDVLANQIRGAISGMGTDEATVFQALGGATTAVERASLDKRYQELFGDTLEDDVRGDLSDRELERAEALMSGEAARADAAAIAEAIEGLGTDEAAVVAALRGKTPAQIAAIQAEYERLTGESLGAAVRDDFSEAELDQTEALISGDADAADAAELEVAMAGMGTDEEGMRSVFTRIRAEEERRAREEGLTPAELQQRIRERNERVVSRFEDMGYGDFRTRMMAELADVDESAVADMEDRDSPLLRNGDIGLMDAMVGGDESAIDAARLDRERRSTYASDDETEAVVRNQRTRAERDVALDMRAERDRLELMRRSGDLSNDAYQEALADFQRRDSNREEAIRERAGANMEALGEAYQSATGGVETLDEYVDRYTSGVSHDEIEALVANGGRLSDEDEIFFAVEGIGSTDEARIREVLSNKTPEEIQRIREAYERRHGAGSFDDDILGDLDGRDDLDIGHMLRYGDPSTFSRRLAAASTPAERERILGEMRTMLRERQEFEQTGLVGGLFAAGLDPMNSASQLEAAIANGEAYAEALNAQEDAEPGAPVDPALAAARSRFETTFGGARESQEQVRKQIDAYSDAAVQVGAAVAGIAVTIATAGTAGPAVAALYGALASAAMGMAIESTMRGAAYGYEDMGVDVAVGAVDAVVSVATAGVGGALLDGVEAAIRQQVVRQVAAEGAEEVAESVMRNLVREAIAEAIEGGIGAMPSAAVETMLNDDVWRSGDPWGQILDATGQAGAMGAAMGAGMSGGMGAFNAARGAPTPRADAPSSAGDTPTAHGGAPDAPASGAPTGDGVRPADVDGPVAPDTPPPYDTDFTPPPDADPEIAAARAARGEEPSNAPAARSPSRPDGAPTPARTEGGPDAVYDVDADPHVGEDGIIDLDDPRNRHLIADQMASQAPGELAKDPVASRELFEGFVDQTPDMEIGLVRNNETGEYIVVQGSPGSVDTRHGQGRIWEELMSPDSALRGRWELIVHSHPVDASGTTPPYARVPSGGAGDMWISVHQAQLTGQSVTQEIRITTDAGADVTRYGFDPNHEKPYFIDFPGPDGTRQPHRFATIEDYHDWYRGEFGGDLRPIPSGFPGPRRTPPPTTGQPDQTPGGHVDDTPTEEIDLSELDTTQEIDTSDLDTTQEIDLSELETTQVREAPTGRSHTEQAAIDDFDDAPTQVREALSADSETTQVMERPDFDSETTQVMERPDFDSETTQVMERPDFDSEITQVMERPDFDSETTQVREAPEFDPEATQEIDVTDLETTQEIDISELDFDDAPTVVTGPPVASAPPAPSSPPRPRAAVDQVLQRHGVTRREVGRTGLTPEQFAELPPATQAEVVAQIRDAGDPGVEIIDPTSVTELDLPEYQLAVEEASDSFARLSNIEQGKNVAGTTHGDQALSGYHDPEAVERVRVAGTEAGHETTPHTFDREFEGQYESSHSERKIAENTGRSSLASSKDLCPLCQRWFAARAESLGEPFFVADPTGVRVFMPDGRVVTVPHPSGADTSLAGSMRRGR